MTEVPEHLLARSRERREALGLATGEGGGAPTAPAEASPARAEGGGDAGAPAAAPVPAAAAAAPAIPAEPPKPQLPAYVAELRRTRVPLWVMPVLVLLPFWGFLYVGAFASHKVEEQLTPMQLGQQVYRANCSSCHGGTGEGASGPALNGEEVELTFPDEADHAEWVRTGSQSKAKGTPYGDPDREGGQRTVQVQGMPAFSGTLSPEEIEAVVLFEREGL